MTSLTPLTFPTQYRALRQRQIDIKSTKCIKSCHVRPIFALLAMPSKSLVTPSRMLA